MRVAEFKYEKTMQNIFVLHPTAAFKAAFGLLYMVLPASIWNNTMYFDTMTEVRNYMGTTEMEFSPCCVAYESERNENIFSSLW